MSDEIVRYVPDIVIVWNDGKSRDGDDDDDGGDVVGGQFNQFEHRIELLSLNYPKQSN